MLSFSRIRDPIVMENLCLVNITKHKMTWYIPCCVIRFLVYWACYRAMATKPEIGTMSILGVKMVMLIAGAVPHSVFIITLWCLLYAWGSVKRCKYKSLTKTFNKNTEFFCITWKNGNLHLAKALRKLSRRILGEKNLTTVDIKMRWLSICVFLPDVPKQSEISKY